MAGDGEGGFAFEEANDAFAEEGVVVDEEDANGSDHWRSLDASAEASSTTKQAPSGDGL